MTLTFGPYLMYPIFRPIFAVFSSLAVCETVSLAEPGQAGTGENKPTVYSVNVDGRELPYGKAYGDFDKAPRPVAQAVAVYPPALLKAGTKGAAVVRFTVDKKGRPKEIAVIQASDPEFGKAAAVATERDRFEPAIKNQNAVPCTMELLFTFPGPFVRA